MILQIIKCPKCKHEFASKRTDKFQCGKCGKKWKADTEDGWEFDFEPLGKGAAETYKEKSAEEGEEGEEGERSRSSKVILSAN